MTTTINSKEVQELILPASALPEGWYIGANAKTDAKLHEIYRNAINVYHQDYLHNNNVQDNIGAYQVLALYGSEDCARNEMDYFLTNFPDTDKEAPQASWDYKSAIADEYRFAVFFPYKPEGEPIESYILHVLVKARYGIVISEFSLSTRLIDITPDKLKTIILALDEQFATHKELWRK